jgi:hypothetical protein
MGWDSAQIGLVGPSTASGSRTRGTPRAGLASVTDLVALRFPVRCSAQPAGSRNLLPHSPTLAGAAGCAAALLLNFMVP